ncbi:sensor histidine kinase [Rothia sp. ZJ1223]|uniref:sensor histidine kinase n=1 Tax=Rothia sp. ZJ1223 TaxID=2811098 RepID=UPI00195F1D60|nr:sensor histidine kinase [Rothia sp. ZJ1223]MBM7052128.1 sensor domain-containing protein [Rothia sp. ZJ1223]
MNTSPTFSEEPTRPLVPEHTAQLPPADPQGADAGEDPVPGVASVETRPHKTLWRRMASPFYVLGVGPWLAIITLVLLAVVSSTLVSVLMPFVASSLIFLASGVLLLLAPFTLIFATLLAPPIAVCFGYFERWRLRMTGHGEVPNGHVPVPLSQFTHWYKVRFTEVATWRELGSLILGQVISTLAAVVMAFEALCLWAAGLLFWVLAIKRDTINLWYPNNAYFQGMTDREIAEYREYGFPFDPNIDPDNPQWQLTPEHWWLPIALILAGLFVFAYLNGIIGGASASLSKMVLSPRPEEYERKLAKLTASRSTIVDSFESERRRIERNLHDGVQQELVNISLRLGLAEMEAKNLVAAGHPAHNLHTQVAQAKGDLTHALETLRNTVRGIYPAVLEDHGLHAALEELAHHTIIPTHLDYRVNVPLPRDAERVAYYTANEAVANALKHSSASALTITATNSAAQFILDITDNGGGGADPTRGTGLAGLRERAETLGGTVEVTSVPRASSTVTLTLPLPGC